MWSLHPCQHAWFVPGVAPAWGHLSLAMCEHTEGYQLPGARGYAGLGRDTEEDEDLGVSVQSPEARQAGSSGCTMM